jgi:signal transduction histidine kinase
VFGIAFIIALNVAIRLDRATTLQPDLTTATLIPSETGPGQATSRFDEGQRIAVQYREVQQEFSAETLQRMQTWSLFAVIGLAVASGVGGWVLSGVLLRPVRDITAVASEISATNLGRRINHQGPDDELKDLADTFDSMIGRLERAFDNQRRFVQDASHELRTPLAAIRTNIEVTEMDGDATLDDYRELLDTVKVQTERLARLSDDLMLLTTSDDGHVHTEPTNTVDVANEVIAQLRPLAAQREVRLRIESQAAAPARANADFLYRCVFNLVDNAIKYSGAGAEVLVQVRPLGNRVEVNVKDNGPGIPPADRLHIFDRFYRVDKGRSRREGGSGLGLAIVRELCEVMGGDVRVESTEGEGTCFTISLPAVTNR